MAGRQERRTNTPRGGGDEAWEGRDACKLPSCTHRHMYTTFWLRRHSGSRAPCQRQNSRGPLFVLLGLDWPKRPGEPVLPRSSLTMSGGSISAIPCPAGTYRVDSGLPDTCPPVPWGPLPWAPLRTSEEKVHVPRSPIHRGLAPRRRRSAPFRAALAPPTVRTQSRPHQQTSGPPEVEKGGSCCFAF